MKRSVQTSPCGTSDPGISQWMKSVQDSAVDNQVKVEVSMLSTFSLNCMKFALNDVSKFNGENTFSLKALHGELNCIIVYDIRIWIISFI